MINAAQMVQLRQVYRDNQALGNASSFGGMLRLVNAMLAYPTFPAATNVAAGNDVGKVTTRIAEKTDKAPQQVVKAHQAAPGGGQVIVTFHGEAHYMSPWKGRPDSQVFEPDKQRGNALIQEMGAGGLNPQLVVIERGLGNKYNTGALGGSTVREEALIQGEQGIHARSRIVAGFVFLCLAGGPQNTIDQVLFLFGDEHIDILEGIEYFGGHSQAQGWFRKRPRSYLTIGSLKH
jgi:hypothetical protein